MKKCFQCGTVKSVGSGVLSEINGNFICKVCIAKMNSCMPCGHPLTKKTFKITAEMHIVCPKCYESNVKVCAHCSKDYWRANIVLIDNQSICIKCRDEKYFFCHQCNNYKLVDLHLECEVCYSSICASCSPTHNTDICEEMLLGSNLDTRGVITAKIIGTMENCKYIFHDRTVGVEIEAEEGKHGGLHKLLQKTIGISHDGSLGSTGIEIQTPPATYSKLEQIITEACTTMKKRGFRGTKACGLHVHIGAPDFKEDYKKLKQLAQTFFAIEDLLYSMLPPSRWNGRYSKMLNKTYMFSLFKDIKSNSGFDNAWYLNANQRDINSRKGSKYDSTRYYGLNMHSIFYRGTIEFRYHSGTVEETKILSWVSILLHIVDYAANKFKEKEIEKLYDLETSQEKLEYFFKIMDLPEFLREYMIKRIDKFNKGFGTIFNKGKAVRLVEEKNKEAIKDKLEKLTTAEYKICFKKLKEQKANVQISAPITNNRGEEVVYLNSYMRLGIGGFASPVSISSLKNEAMLLARQKVQGQYPGEWEIAFTSDGKEQGFIKSHELVGRVKITQETISKLPDGADIEN